MKLTVLQDERFSCHSCTNCCRDWHVELLSEEIDRVAKLSWPSGDPLHGREVLFKHAGKMFLAHRADGACVFLNESNGRCRIHEQFGETAKPLGCRLFPFQIHPTFKGEASITARFDCPTVRKNIGAPQADELPNLRRIADQIALADGFDEATCCHLDRNQIEAVCEFVGTMLNGFERDEQRALFIFHLCNVLEMTNVEELNREALGQIFPRLRQLVLDVSAAPVKRPNAFQRMSFRSLLGQYLRRDEDVLNKRASRVARAIAMMKILLGFGNFRGLGLSHRSGSVRNARLFRSDLTGGNFALLWRLIRNKLDSFQFMGAGNGGRNFLDGLRSLALLYPLVRAVARYNAANRGATQIEPQDVDEAVAAIEHSFGRSAALNQGSARSLEKVLLRPEVFTRLVRSV